MVKPYAVVRASDLRSLLIHVLHMKVESSTSMPHNVVGASAQNKSLAQLATGAQSAFRASGLSFLIFAEIDPGLLSLLIHVLNMKVETSTNMHHNLVVASDRYILLGQLPAGAQAFRAPGPIFLIIMEYDPITNGIIRAYNVCLSPFVPLYNAIVIVATQDGRKGAAVTPDPASVGLSSFR